MKIETLYISDFGKLHDLRLDFSDGINVVSGENEAGKSTICAFIKFIFYGLSGRGEEKLRYISWNASRASGYIEVSDGDKKYRIEREAIYLAPSSEKININERNVITESATGTQVFRGMNAGEVFFGIDEEVFESTVFVGQMGDKRVGGKGLAEAAENIMSSGSESINAEKAMTDLDSARLALMHKSRRKGKIGELLSEKESLEAQLEEAQKTAGESIRLEGRRRYLREKIASEQKRLEKYEAQSEMLERYAVKQLCEKRLATSDKLKSLSELRDKLEGAEKHGGEKVFCDEYISELELLVRELDTLSAQYDAAKREKLDAENKSAELGEKRALLQKFGKDNDSRVLANEKIHALEKSKKSASAGLVCASLLATASLAVLILSAFGTLSLMSPAAAATAFFVSATVLMLTVLSSKRKTVLRLCREFGCDSAEEFEKAYAAVLRDEPMLLYIEEECKKAEENEKTALGTLEAAKVKARKKLSDTGFEVGNDVRDSLISAEGACRAERESIEKIKLQIIELNGKIYEIDKTLSAYDKEYVERAVSEEYDAEQISKTDAKTVRTNCDYLRGTISSMKEKLAEEEKTLAVLAATSVRPDEISERLFAVSKEAERLTEKFDAYMLAIDSIKEARLSLRGGLAPRIAARASEIMASVSRGKYSTVLVDGEFSLTYLDGDKTRKAETLSAGTSDLIYISLRMALADVLCEKCTPPLIFDESFSRTDDARLRAALGILSDMASNNRQTILFTCHGREIAAMESIGECNVVRL